MTPNQSVILAYVAGLALLLGYVLLTAISLRAATHKQALDRRGGRS